MDIKILSPGEKLKVLRQQYKIKQSELCGTYITRNMLSMIETNKTALNPSTAQVLFENMRELCKAKGLPFNTTLEYLLESPTIQAQSIASTFISNLISHPELIKTFLHNNDFFQMSLLLEKYNLNQERTILFEIAGTFFESQHLYREALTYFLVSLECINQKDADPKYIDITYHLMHCHYYLNQFKDVLDYSYLFLHYQPHCSSCYTEQVYNYTIHSYYKLLKYAEALDLISIYREHFTLTTELKFIKAHCLRKLNRPKEAISLYDSLLKQHDLALEEEIKINLHLIHTHLECSNLLQANKLFEKVLPLIHIYKKVSYGDDLIEIYGYLASIYATQKEFDIALKYTCLALNQILLKLDSSRINTILDQALTYISSCSISSQAEFIKLYGKILCSPLTVDASYTLNILILSYYSDTPNLMPYIVSSIEANNTLNKKKIPTY